MLLKRAHQARSMRWLVCCCHDANMGGQMPQRDEEFPMVLTVDESGVSISPSWCLTAILLITGHPSLDSGCRCPQLTDVVNCCQSDDRRGWVSTRADELPSVL